MRLHRFYVRPETELKHDFWLHDKRLLHQWYHVLRFRSGQQLILFDGVQVDRLYRLEKIVADEAHLVLVTDYARQLPIQKIYLLWSLLKKDKNDWVLQKCTELGVSHFWPLIAARSEKTGFSLERGESIVIEAAEQSGRSDIPTVREPMLIPTALAELSAKIPLFVCDQDGETIATPKLQEFGLIIGPEGGWSEEEAALFDHYHISHLHLTDFTLRSETASVTAVSKLLQ